MSNLTTFNLLWFLDGVTAFTFLIAVFLLWKMGGVFRSAILPLVLCCAVEITIATGTLPLVADRFSVFVNLRTVGRSVELFGLLWFFYGLWKYGKGQESAG